MTSKKTIPRGWWPRSYKGTEEVEGISLYMGKLKDGHLNLSCQVFDKMPNLRLLLFTHHIRSYEVHLPNGLNSLPDDLIILRWQRYPLRALPSNFSLEKLVKLDLSQSNIEQLWEGTKHAPKLKWLILRNCAYLIRIPNLSDFLSLETVDLSYCKSLVEFPSPVKQYNKLRYLHMASSSNVEFLSSFQQLNKLRYLDLSECINVTKFPLTSASIERLNLRNTAIEEVPSSIQSLTNLTELDLSGCTRLKHISASIFKLKSVRSLNLDYISELETFPEISETIEILNSLELSGTAITDLHSSIEHLNGLQRLTLHYCKNLEMLPKLPVALEELDAINCKQLCQALPDASEFKRCITSKYHNRCITRSSRQLCPLEYEYVNFSFTNCLNLDQKAGSEEPPTDFSICLPGTEIPEWFTYQSSGSSINIPVLRQDLINRKLMGFALCVVLGIEEYHGYSEVDYLSVEIYCHSETWRDYIFFISSQNLIDEPVLIINSNHILLGYSLFSEFLFSSQNLEMLIANDSDYVNIPFEFKSEFKVKYCAVHPTYAEPIEIIGVTIEDIGVTSLKRSGRSNGNEEEVEPHPKRIFTQPN
ncbi:hypothetical protein LWI29_025651 [Acer saccharum]|uniref:C-JID domain-containing protein n=1 Tax=Acer saccharum TaxID=4024 RepID=A0AA39T615_ACESA|nr:hypothetical protein LWI29_025651 [Acer saccharum]